MEEELGAGNKKPEILSKLAQYELTLQDWIGIIMVTGGGNICNNCRKMAGQQFQTQFGFVTMLCKQSFGQHREFQ